jgi:adenylylsulfate kinase
MVIWLMGLSGSGKTTLGEKLKAYLEGLGKKAYIIDGDKARAFYENDLGYTEAERFMTVKRVMLPAHVLSECGIIAIVCNIHPFEELRELARRIIHQYNEIYLEHHIDSCRERDVKSMYREHEGKTEIVGMDVRFDEPRNSDLVLDTDKETVEESFEKLLSYIKTKYPEEFE